MTIDLTQLRQDIHIIDSGNIDHGMTLIDPDDLLALIDIAEAADDLMLSLELHGPDSITGTRLKEALRSVRP